MSANLTPIDTYKLFVNQNIVVIIVEKTYEYANMIINTKTLSKSLRFHQWQNTTSEEVKKLLGITIWMELTIRPKLSDYCATDPLYENTVSK